jgi:hypothetical protein
MKIRPAVLLAPIALSFSLGVAADEAPAMSAPSGASGAPAMTAEQQKEMEIYMNAATPGSEHQRLAKMAGDYDVVVRSWEKPDAPPMEEKGTVKRTMMLDGRILSEEFHGTMMGMPFDGHGMSGYDKASEKWWSTWNDTMSTGIMVSQGTCDEKDSCTFNGSWFDAVKKAPVNARMTTSWTSPSVEVFSMYVAGKDGKEAKMMEITYTKR